MQYRHELKYFINQSHYLTLRSRLKHVLSQDKFADATGSYHIRSLYFDSFEDKALHEKVIGINKRSKFRIRFYNDNHDFIKLEKKMKNNGMTAKLSTKITKKQVLKILDGDIEWLKTSGNHLFEDLYVQMTTCRLKPKTIVDYTREAYVYKPGNVRITIDRNIKSGIACCDLFTKEHTTSVLQKDQIVLEVKYDRFLPSIVQMILEDQNRQTHAISKYVLCRQYH